MGVCKTGGVCVRGLVGGRGGGERTEGEEGGPAGVGPGLSCTSYSRACQGRHCEAQLCVHRVNRRARLENVIHVCFGGGVIYGSASMHTLGCAEHELKLVMWFVFRGAMASSVPVI